MELMLKDIPVLRIEGFSMEILNYDLLPVGLRYPDVNFDDVFHGWTDRRVMHVGRTNGKAITAAYGLSQTSLYAIGKACHFATLNDCYWIREDDEVVGWDDVNLFCNSLDEKIISTALFGVSQRLLLTDRVGYAELGSQGYSAKAWVREDDGIYMYKVARKEIPASQILDQLGFSHVRYFPCSPDEVALHVSPQVETNLGDEIVVKSRNIATEEISIFSFEDFAVYAERHDFNPFEYFAEQFPLEYSEMIVADFILGNSDRHEGNYGFFMDNNTGEIISPYPLMDHDRVFDSNFYCQTVDRTMSQKVAAKKYKIPIPKVARPEHISDEEWSLVNRNINSYRQFFIDVPE